MWIEMHNVPILAMLLVGAIFMSGDLSWRFGLIYAAISFLLLSGRVLTHGLDLSKNHPHWKQYVATNLILNVVASALIVFLFWVF